MFGACPQVRLGGPEFFPSKIRSLQDSEPVSQSKRSLGFDLDAAGPVKPIASAVVFAAVA